MLDLSKVTLCCATTMLYEETEHALLRCLQQARFHNVAIFTDQPKKIGGSIQNAFYLPMPKYKYDFEGYKKVSIWNVTGQMRQIIEDPRIADWILFVQWDGFIVNTSSWTDEFFNYDYIGAPWPPGFAGTGGRVGNGGFALLTKRFCRAVTGLNLPETEMAGFPSDVAVCCNIFRMPDGEVRRFHRDRLEAAGMTWAPVELATKFSAEDRLLGNAFGFHGKETLAEVKDRGLY
jgi:hypothetical protein